MAQIKLRIAAAVLAVLGLTAGSQFGVMPISKGNKRPAEFWPSYEQYFSRGPARVHRVQRTARDGCGTSYQLSRRERRNSGGEARS